jgi:hypothetical protein
MSILNGHNFAFSETSKWPNGDGSRQSLWPGPRKTTLCLRNVASVANMAIEHPFYITLVVCFDMLCLYVCIVYIIIGK